MYRNMIEMGGEGPHFFLRSIWRIASHDFEPIHFRTCQIKLPNTITMGYFGKQTEIDSTDEESGVHEIADILRNVDVRTVSSASANQGFETSFLMIEGRRPDAEIYGDDDGFQPKDDTWRAHWLVRPYKSEKLWEDIRQANHKGVAGHAAVLNTLKNSGVMIFIIDSKVSTTSADILDSVRNVLHHVTKEERARPGFTTKEAQRCLLYRDTDGRFFNLVLDDQSSSLASDWEGHLSSFSCFQAVSLAMVLSRSFSCVAQEHIVVENYVPAYFAALLGVVFKEEISHVWTNVGMMVRGIPSIAAYSVTTQTHSDWLRKSIVFAFLIAAVAGHAEYGSIMNVSSFVGLSLTILVLLTNLGSRAWGFMAWRPIQNFGIFEPVFSFFAAALTGLFFPFLGHRQVESGGKAALESTFGIAFLSALVFVVSDYDSIQKLVVMGSEKCSQDWIVRCVGGWWFVATLCSLVAIYRKGRQGIWPEDEEPLLTKNHKSPVGFSVPNLPEFPINVAMAQRGLFCMGMKLEFVAMLLLTMGMGSFLLFLSFSDFDDDLNL